MCCGWGITDNPCNLLWMGIRFTTFSRYFVICLSYFHLSHIVWVYPYNFFETFPLIFMSRNVILFMERELLICIPDSIILPNHFMYLFHSFLFMSGLEACSARSARLATYTSWWWSRWCHYSIPLSSSLVWWFMFSVGEWEYGGTYH